MMNERLIPQVGEQYLTSLEKSRTANRGEATNPQHLLDRLESAPAAAIATAPPAARAR